MQRILNDIADKGTLVLLYYGSNRHFIITTLLSASSEGIWLEVSPDKETNEKILQSTGSLTLVTLHRGVKIQFPVEAVYLAPPSNDAFYMDCPPWILRIQRRSFFRMSTLGVSLQCVIPIPPKPDSPHTQPVTRTSPIINLSGSGLALSCKANEPDLVPGMTFPNCTINLPSVAVINVTLLVRNSIEVSMTNDTNGKRIGCEFIDMDMPTSTQLQHYLSYLQSKELSGHLSD